MGRGWAGAGAGPDLAGPLVLTALVLSRAVTIRFGFGEDHSDISVDTGDKGGCGEISEEATIIVQAEDAGGLCWERGCRWGCSHGVKWIAGTEDQVW